ncbi:hypothetical protein ACQPZ2_01395 [Nocardia pseudovaccinii]|uniref:hypothetical protein n=1 Tax=Nocardia pseudovaccinii TaxID=189540 RepID=UPI003D8A6F14
MLQLAAVSFGFEFGQKRFEAGGNCVVPLSFSGPSAVGGVLGEGVFQTESIFQAGVEVVQAA